MCLDVACVSCFEQGLDREAMENALARAEMRAKTPSAKIAARAVRSLKKKIARIAELEGRQDSGKSLSADQVGRLTTILPSYLPLVTSLARCARPPNLRMLPGGTIRKHEKHVTDRRADGALNLPVLSASCSKPTCSSVIELELLQPTLWCGPRADY